MTMENPEENEGSGAIVWAMALLVTPLIILALSAITGCFLRRFS